MPFCSLLVPSWPPLYFPSPDPPVLLCLSLISWSGLLCWPCLPSNLLSLLWTLPVASGCTLLHLYNKSLPFQPCLGVVMPSVCKLSTFLGEGMERKKRGSFWSQGLGELPYSAMEVSRKLVWKGWSLRESVRVRKTDRLLTNSKKKKK